MPWKLRKFPAFSVIYRKEFFPKLFFRKKAENENFRNSRKEIDGIAKKQKKYTALPIVRFSLYYNLQHQTTKMLKSLTMHHFISIGLNL